MNARLPFRPSRVFLIAILVFLIPTTLLAGPGSGSGGHGGGGGGHAGGGHAGGGHSGGGHMGSAGGGAHSGAGGASYAAGSTASGGHAGPFYSAPAANEAGGHFDSGNAGHYAVFSAPGMQGVRDAATEAHLAQMAGQGWHFLPSAGVRPVARPTRAPANHPVNPSLANHPAILPIHPHRHGPYVYGALTYPYGGYYTGTGGCFYNGFTNVCTPGGGYIGACPRFGVQPCGPNYPIWGSYGSGWIGYGGYGLFGGYQDLGAGEPEPQYDAAPPADDLYPGGSSMDISGGDYGETPPADSSEVGPALPSQRGVTAAAPTQLIFKNGSAYAVTACWISAGEIYYRPVYGGLNHIPLEQFDLAASAEANMRAGVPFTLSTQAPPK